MKSQLYAAVTLSAAGLAALLSGCNANNGPSTSPGIPMTNSYHAAAPARRMHHRTASGKIQHVVIIVQENRSLNNLFYRYPKARTRTYGFDSNGNKITLQPLGLETPYDV